MDLFRGALYILYYFHHSYLKGRKMKNDQFHIPFIKSLFLIAFVTIVSMVSVRLFVPKLYSNNQEPQEYTSFKSYNEAKAGQ